MLSLIHANPRPRAILDMQHTRSMEPRTSLWIIRASLAVTVKGERVTWGRDSGVMDHTAFRARIREALDYQISARGGALPPWRKLEASYQRGMRQDAHILRMSHERHEPVPVGMLRTPELRRVVGYAGGGR